MKPSRLISFFVFQLSLLVFPNTMLGQEKPDTLRTFQYRAAELGKSDWIHWGDQPGNFSNWKTHSNRLVPVYAYGMTLDSVKGENSIYRDKARLVELYGQVPRSTFNEDANYFDQTDIYRLQKKAWQAGKKHVILMVFDGMDWQTTQAASIYRNREVLYTKGRGKGLGFLDYQPEGESDYGFCVTAPHSGGMKFDVNAQTVIAPESQKVGGYSAELGGATPWTQAYSATYLMGKQRTLPHPWTDSASSATSLNSGIKTYNSAINVGPDGKLSDTLAHQMQRDGFAVGAVTNVPISHATPASVYAHNVNRSDYQDLTRDLLGLKSISHQEQALPGLDVLIGCGWSSKNKDDRAKQGKNYVPGNIYLGKADRKRIDADNGGRYVVGERTAGRSGKDVLAAATARALKNKKRLFGFFGVGGKGHLPYQTADGNYDPTRGAGKAEAYTEKELLENPTLADMTGAALAVLGENEKGFFLCVEAGDVDWANHNNNIDDSIGGVFSGDDAFKTIVDWVEANSNWDETCLIVTADHGHMMVLDDPAVLTGERDPIASHKFEKLLKAKRAKDERIRKAKEAKEAAAAKKAAAEKT